MRHGKKFNHLSRKSAHRKAMLSNMASSLIIHKRIKTTLAKAKALRGYVEPLITRSKEDTTHSRRIVFSYLQNKEAVTELFREVSLKIANRPGGYTRILKTGNRLGDNAEMCYIELVDYNEYMLSETTSDKVKSIRRRRGGTKKTVTAETQGDQQLVGQNTEAATAEVVAEEVKNEETPSAKAATEENKAEAAESSSQIEDAAGEEKKDEESGEKNTRE